MRLSLELLVLALLLGFLSGCQFLSESRGRPRQLAAGIGSSGDSGALSPGQQADVQIALGRSLEKQGEADRAIAAYREALRRDPGRADAALRLAVLHDRMGRFQESVAFYHQAIEARPGDPDIYCNMGYSLYLQRRDAEAEMNLRQAIAIAPGHQRAQNNLGLLLARNDRLDEALVAFRRGGSPPADAHLNLAFALSVDRRWAEARDHYQRALAADPKSDVARTRLQELETLIARVPPPAPSIARDRSAIPASAEAMTGVIPDQTTGR